MQPTVLEVNVRGFTAMIDGLAAASGKAWEEVLLDQTRALLQVCIRKTPAAQASGIVKRVARKNNHIVFDSGHIISLWKKADTTMFLDDSTFRGRGKPPRIVGGKSYHDMVRRRWSNQRWGRFLEYEERAKKMRKAPEAALLARGVSKKSWLQVAEDLGVNLDVPAYVRRAVPSNGKRYKNGLARKLLGATASFIEISNDHPIVVEHLDGVGIVNRAIATRLTAFRIEVTKGVFDDLKARAQRYPGIFTA